MSISDRAKHQAALHGRIVGAGLLLVGLLAIGGAGYVYLNPPVEEIPAQETDVQSFESSVRHSAVVVNSTPLYDEGERLRNQPRYFFGATPVLNLSAVAVVPDDRAVTVSHRLTVVIRVTADQEEFFERQRVLATDKGTVNDGRFAVNATMNATRIRAETSEVQNEVTGLASVTPQLRLRTNYDTESTQGDTYNGTLSSTTTIQFADRGYWLGGNLSDSATESTFVGGGVRRQEPDMAIVSGLGAIGVLSIALGGIVAYWSTRRIDLRELKMRIDRAQYDEWISVGDFPSGRDRQYVYINTLEDLVDIGIDTNNRVIYDPEIESYAVPDGDIIYYHAADPRAVSSWLDLT